MNQEDRREDEDAAERGSREVVDTVQTQVISQPDDQDILSGSDLRRKSLQGVLTEEVKESKPKRKNTKKKSKKTRFRVPKPRKKDPMGTTTARNSAEKKFSDSIRQRPKREMYTSESAAWIPVYVAAPVQSFRAKNASYVRESFKRNIPYMQIDSEELLAEMSKSTVWTIGSSSWVPENIPSIYGESSRKLSGTSVKSMRSSKQVTIVENTPRGILKNEAPKMSGQSLKSSGSISIPKDAGRTEENRQTAVEDVTDQQPAQPEPAAADPTQTSNTPTTNTSTTNTPTTDTNRDASNTPSPSTAPNTSTTPSILPAANSTKGAAKVLGGWVRKRFGNRKPRKAGVAPRLSQSRQRPT